jgi:NAD(P)-dependent dehydrogenase (short-subunit alcohol dehydrogenase family)
VYIGGRSIPRCDEAITAIKLHIPDSKGALKPFVADLADLRTIKPAVDTFLAAESRLDVLFLNAGVMTPPDGTKTANEYDLEIGVHCLSSFLLVSLLEQVMQNVASRFCHPNQSIRVVWVSSMLNLGTPRGGVQLDENEAPKQLKGMDNYMQSKAAMYLLAHEFSARQQSRTGQTANGASNEMSNGNPFGVLHVCLNPGLMKTELQRHSPPPMRLIMGTVFKGPGYGAYTELYAGLGPDVRAGDFVIPWGRKGEVPGHILESTKTEDGRASVSKRVFEWCEGKVKPFI